MALFVSASATEQQKGICGGKLLILSLISLHVAWEHKSHMPSSSKLQNYVCSS